MSKLLKYEKPKLIDLSAAEWEIGTGVCHEGSGVSQADITNYANCTNGDRASACFNGNGIYHT
jgi:hypothetical protein